MDANKPMDPISTPKMNAPEISAVSQFFSPLMRRLSALTSVLAVYGYCVMQGVANALDMEGGNLWSAPGDVLHYAFLGIMTAVKRFPSYPNLTWLGDIIFQWRFWLATGMVVCLTWFSLTLDRSTEAYAARNHRLKNNWLTYWAQKKFGHLKLWQWFLLIASSLLIPSILIMAWFSLLTTAAVIIFFGFIGFSNGLNHVDDHYSTKPHCIAAMPSQDSDTHTVHCVRVRWQADGIEHIETGFLIASSSSYALLAKPTARKGLRVPLNDKTILEAVDKF
ncbi:MAG: hypothetical protein ACKOXU_14210 [Limnohabitans sp.]